LLQSLLFSLILFISLFFASSSLFFSTGIITAPRMTRPLYSDLERRMQGNSLHLGLIMVNIYNLHHWMDMLLD
jgi:hypothetical protein